MSERVLHEWTASGSIIRIVEDDRGFFGWSAERGIVTDLIPTVFCRELARLAARVSELELDREGRIRSSDYDKALIEELEAEVAVLSGTACAEEQAEGNGPCGACRTCRNKRITELEAENTKLRRYFEIVEEIRVTVSNVFAFRLGDLDAAREEVDK